MLATAAKGLQGAGQRHKSHARKSAHRHCPMPLSSWSTPCVPLLHARVLLFDDADVAVSVSPCCCSAARVSRPHICCLQARVVLPDAADLAGMEEDDEAEFGGKLQPAQPTVPDVPAAPAASPVLGKDPVAGMKPSSKSWAGARCCLWNLQQVQLVLPGRASVAGRRQGRGQGLSLWLLVVLGRSQ